MKPLQQGREDNLHVCLPKQTEIKKNHQNVGESRVWKEEAEVMIAASRVVSGSKKKKVGESPTAACISIRH